jgi:hypothetical protein
MKTRNLLLLIMIPATMAAQEKPYYYQIPDAPSTYTATSVAARLVDGVGFRYFWATEGLTEKDLNFRPSKEARTSFETLIHINSLTEVLLNAVNKRPTTGAAAPEKWTFSALREKTLQNIRAASEILKQPSSNLEEMDMIFERTNGRQVYPFWNLVNGPIADALWHIGQVVTFRRSSGNPLPAGVNVLEGTKKD